MVHYTTLATTLAFGTRHNNRFPCWDLFIFVLLIYSFKPIWIFVLILQWFEYLQEIFKPYEVVIKLYLIRPLSLRLSWMILLTKDSSPPSHTSSPGAPEWALRGKGLLDVLATFFGSNSSSELKNGGLHMQKLYTVSASSTPSSIVSSFTERTVQCLHYFKHWGKTRDLLDIRNQAMSSLSSGYPKVLFILQMFDAKKDAMKSTLS